MKRLREKVIDGERVEFTKAFREGAWSRWNGVGYLEGPYRRRRARVNRERWRHGHDAARLGKVTREEVGPEPGKGPTAGRARCPAHWEVPGPDGNPIGSKVRGCNRLATTPVDLRIGSPSTYCQWHGEDRKRPYNRVALAGLVLHAYCRNDEPMFMPMGRTSQGGASSRDRLETPWRMGTEVLADMLALGLPGFVISEPSDQGRGFLMRTIAVPPLSDMPIALRARLKAKAVGAPASGEAK